MTKELPASVLIKPRDTIMTFHGKKYKINKYSLPYELAIADKFGISRYSKEKIKETFETGTQEDILKMVMDIKHYGEDELKTALINGNLNEKIEIASEIIYMLIDDKKDWPSYIDFVNDIAGLEDKAVVLVACNTAMGATIPAITPEEAAELEDEKKNVSKPRARTFWSRLIGFCTGGKKSLT